MSRFSSGLGVAVRSSPGSEPLLRTLLILICWLIYLLMYLFICAFMYLDSFIYSEDPENDRNSGTAKFLLLEPQYEKLHDFEVADSRTSGSTKTATQLHAHLAPHTLNLIP